MKKGGENVSQVSGAVLPYSPEYNALGADPYLLTRVAQTSGGENLEPQKPQEVFQRKRIPARLPQDIWLPLLMIAAILFPLDVAVRRLMWGEAEAQNAAAKLRGRFQRAPKPKPEKPRDAAMDRLRKAKQRARSTPATPEPSTPASPSNARPGETATQETDEDELSPMERLREAKRRARGE